ncbi:MAG: DsbA family protein [Candidatus Nanohaloarchaea archaeon]
MNDSDGITLELTTKQAALLTLALGLIIGGLGGFAGGMAVSGPVQDSVDEPSESADSNSDSANDGSGEESGSDLVSLDGIDLEDEPSKGEEDAPIKVVEYNEFGCPFCAEWNGIDASSRTPIDQMDIAGSLESQYIDEGEVELISKDYPVPNLHPNGPEAHKAANCVYEHEQDSYWDYHDELFERRDSWMQSGDGDTDETFKEISDDLGLDTETVMQCYEDSENTEANEDRENAIESLGQFGTPTFFVGNKEKGFVKIEGAQPLSRFEEAFETVESE